MPSISNTGKAVTVAFTDAECARLTERGGDSWKWQVPEFSIDDNGIGRLRLRADMFEGRKLGAKRDNNGDHWMLSIPSAALPLAPFFSRVKVEAIFPEGDPALTEMILPRELPALSERKQAQLKAGLTKPKAVAKPVKARQIEAPTPTTALVASKPRDTSNLTLLIEGMSFRFDVPVEERLRIMADVSRFAVEKKA